MATSSSFIRETEEVEHENESAPKVDPKSPILKYVPIQRGDLGMGLH